MLLFFVYFVTSEAVVYKKVIGCLATLKIFRNAVVYITSDWIIDLMRESLKYFSDSDSSMCIL